MFGKKKGVNGEEIKRTNLSIEFPLTTRWEEEQLQYKGFLNNLKSIFKIAVEKIISKNAVEKNISKNAVEKIISKNTVEKNISKNAVEKIISKNTVEKNISKIAVEKIMSKNAIEKRVSNKKRRFNKKRRSKNVILKNIK